jgi:hypothetical protein
VVAAWGSSIVPPVAVQEYVSGSPSSSVAVTFNAIVPPTCAWSGLATKMIPGQWF